MKKYFFIAMVFALSTATFAQDDGYDVEVSSKLKKTDRVIFDIYSDMWQDTPTGISYTPTQRGFGYSSMQDFPLGNSNFSFAIGVGINMHNFYSDGILTTDTNGISEFIPIPKTYTDGTETKDISYKINKLTLTYIETPIEFRFRSKGSNTFKVYAGFKFGMLLQEHTKYLGDDFISGTDNQIKFKEYKHQNFERFRYGPTIRIGYNMISLFGSYTMTGIFETDKGPGMYPITVGISIMPY